MLTTKAWKVLFLSLFFCASVAAQAQETGDEEYHPTDAQIKQLEQPCSINEVGMASLEAKVSDAISLWRKATSLDGPLTALRQLDKFFEPVKNGGNLSGKKSIYVFCVEKAVRQFVDARRERPQTVFANGNSEPLHRSSFSSEDEVWHRGCQQAEANAVEKLRTRCGERTFVQTNSDCAQDAGEVRNYSAQVSGECRLR